MASIYVKEVLKLSTAAGTATGFVTFDDVSPFFEGAYGNFIDTVAPLSQHCRITEVDLENQRIGLRFEAEGAKGVNYGRSNCSAFPLGSIFSMYAQPVAVPSTYASGKSTTSSSVTGRVAVATTTPWAVLTIDGMVLVNLTVAGASHIDLPAVPTNNLVIMIKDAKGDAAVNNITIHGNGKTIDSNPSVLVTANYDYIKVLYNSSLGEWSVIT
jgi:hypothetical protein